MLKTRIQRLAVTGMLVAVGILLPFATSHGMGVPGTVLLPMHIPALLCGLLCGPWYGAVCGLILPVLNSTLTGMPAIYPMMPIMAAELMTYGLVGGLIYHKTRLGSHKLGVYVALPVAMVCGRIAYGLTFGALLLISGQCKAPTVWAAVVTGVPGIVVQLLLIPAIMLAVAGGQAKGKRAAVRSALHLIEQDTLACAVIDGDVIVRSEQGRGIGPILKLHDEGVLKGACVVDKIVGKAAAMIMTHGGVRECYGVTMSRSAEQWLRAHGVKVAYGKLVEVIINREGNGMCPMEQTVQHMDDEAAAIEALRQKRQELMARS